MIYLAALVIAGFVWYVLKPDEREKVLRTVLGVFGQAKHAARAAHQRRRQPEAFDAALRARTRWVVAAPLLAAVNVFVFVSAAGAPGPIAAPDTLLEWGASVGPLTSNGDWARLVTALFVHASVFGLLVNVAALLQVGLLLERMVGPLAFAAVYLMSGLFASLVSLAAFPVSVSAGASGAVAGLYGLLLVTVVWGLLQRGPVSLPLRALKDLAPVTGVFVLYNLFSSGVQTGAELAGLLTGLVAGAGLARGVAAARPPLRRVAAATLASVAVAAICAFPLRGISNVRPELDRLVALEARLTDVYGKAVDQFKLGALSARQLAEIIEKRIVPELRAARERLRELNRVPRQQQTLLASADEYLRLRDESFRLRAEALQKANMDTLRAADRRERDSLDALARTKP